MFTTSDTYELSTPLPICESHLKIILSSNASEKVDLVGYLVVVDKIGQQTDNSQRTENDFSCAHFFTSSTVREIFNGLDNQIDHSADGLEDWA